MYWSTWYEMKCPDCRGKSFVNGGDTSDMTGYDPENVKCPYCRTVFDFEGNIMKDAEEYDGGVILMGIDKRSKV